MALLQRQLRLLTPRRRSLLCLLALAALLVILYWPAATLQGMFYVGDIFRLGYPARQEYAAALQQGRVPLWTSHALAGFPSLAEGQTGSYYPLNLLLYGLLPLPAALNYSVLLSLWVAGAGTFLYVRSLGLRRWAALLAGGTFMLGGFLPGHLNHLNMLGAASLLPLLLWAVERAISSEGWRRWAVAATLFGVQGLAGHPQISLMSAMLVTGYAALGPLRCDNLGPVSVLQRARHVGYAVAALALGAVMAAIQWLPTYELTRLSQRGQGLDAEFFTSFSLHPGRFVTMLWPFVQGNPYPLVSLETIGYAGALPLLLAAVALLRRRDRATLGWAAAGAIAFLLTLGRWNPAYRVLVHVPIFNMFRAPARYLLWLDLAIAVLAAAGMDMLLSLAPRPAPAGAGRLGALTGLALMLPFGLWVGRLPVDNLVSYWRFLPLVWLALSVALILLALRRPAGRAWPALAVLLVSADLFTFNAVYNQTYNATMSLPDLRQAPASLSFLREDAGGEPYRVYTSEEIVPVLPVMRESLYPNIQALHGVDSLNGYYPLVPDPQRWLLENLSPRLVDLLNVRYVLIPQVLPVDAESEAYDTNDPLAPSIVGRSFSLSEVNVAALEAEGYLSHSADLPTGTPVCEVRARTAAGEAVVWTLRAGVDLAEWAYRRDDVESVIRHELPPNVARVWPAESGFPPREHVGLTFLARYDLSQPVTVESIEIRPLIPAAFVHLERLRLVGSDHSSQFLSTLVGEGDHVLVYRSPDVAIFRNEDAGPRAFLVHQARSVESEEEARSLVKSPDFEPWEEVVLTSGRDMEGRPLPGDRVVVEADEQEYVRLRFSTEASAYLVLADSYYPGWTATIDGQPAVLEQADVALRAVAVPAGEHVVEMRFAPSSWRLGASVSLAAWGVVAGAMAFGVWRSRVGRT